MLEAGLFSLGIEHWWGLSNRAPTALAQSASAMSETDSYHIDGEITIELISPNASVQPSFNGRFSQDISGNQSRIATEWTLTADKMDEDILGPILAEGKTVQAEMVTSGDELYLRIIDSNNPTWLLTTQDSLSSIGLQSFEWVNLILALAANATGERSGGATIDNTRSKGYQFSLDAQALSDLFAPNLPINSVSAATGEAMLGSGDKLLRELKLTADFTSGNTSGNLNTNLQFSSYNQPTVIEIPTASTPLDTTLNDWLTGNGLVISDTPKGRDAIRKYDLNRIAVALAEYATQTKPFGYPVESAPVDITDSQNLDVALAPYLAKLPQDPSSPEYYYGYQSDGQSFKLTAVLENKTDEQGISQGNYTLFVIESK
jgi:hypothetical protein